MTNPYYTYRFHIYKENDIEKRMIEEYSCPADQALQMKQHLEQHLANLKKDNPDCIFTMDQELIDDETQGTIR